MDNSDSDRCVDDMHLSVRCVEEVVEGRVYFLFFWVLRTLSRYVA